jgi:hypothetical protein
MVGVVTTYRVRLREQSVVILNQCNGGIGILMMTMSTMYKE